LEPRFVEKTLRGWTCFECQKTCEVCPSCRKGAIQMKSGKYGQFYGCSNWRRDGTGCNHTRNPGGSGRRRRRR
jgi:ssDNA-binding Zn-finger/Zn-ribbon topoisomerase 1